jgi:hypothetical protein
MLPAIPAAKLGEVAKRDSRSVSGPPTSLRAADFTLAAFQGPYAALAQAGP